MPIYKSTLNTNKKPDKEKPKKNKEKFSKEKRKKITCLSIFFLSLILFGLILFKNFVQSFFLGTFGILAYPLLLLTAFISLVSLNSKKYMVHKRYLICLSLTIFFATVILHLILTHNIPISNYGKYIKLTYKAQTTAGGIFYSLFTFPICKYLTVVGAYVLNSIAFLSCLGLTVDAIVLNRHKPVEDHTIDNYNFNEFTTLNENTNDVKITFDHRQEDIKKKIAKQKLGIEQNESSIISSSMLIENINEKPTDSRPISKRDYILTPPDIVMPGDETVAYSPFNETNEQPKFVHSQKYTQQVDDIIVNEVEDFYDNAKILETKENSQNYANNISINNEKIQNIHEININNDEFVENIEKTAPKDEIFENFSTNQDNLLFEDEQEEKHIITPNYIEDDEINDYDENTNYINDEVQEPGNIVLPSDVEAVELRPTATFDNSNTTFRKTILEEEKPKQKAYKHYAPYVKPPVDLLEHIEKTNVVTDEECQENIDKLEKVLEDFKIPAKVKAVQIGPAVTRYEIAMPTGISVKKVQMHADDIAMVLASNGGIRIEAPIPGKNAVGIEVPNKTVGSVSMREMVESAEFQNRVNPMSFVLGKDINGTIQFCNLDKMPHLLVAGSTGSGKSVCLNTMLISMLYKSSPEDVRLILIDPKTVEFSVYANLPHLLTPHIITTKEQAINALNWAINEMEYRYTLLQQNEVVNIKDYNNLPIVKNNEVNKLPYIVIVIDELNDLMIDTKREMEERIMKLAQKSRAAGIHLVIATQRPSVDVITGTIKANLPSRIAFALTNFADSKTVLDMGGAEKLLGRGDMLFKPSDLPEPRRVQGAYISSQEVSAVVKFIKANNPTDFDSDTTNAITAVEEHEKNNQTNNSSNNFDPILKDALRWFISANQASITMIQRRFGVGYARAARIIDQMEQNGFISSQDGSKPRQVLITIEKYNQLFPV